MNNLSYEDAKELKDAGFPQGLRSDTLHYFESDGDIVLSRFVDEEFQPDYEYVNSPILDELIEACGEEFVLEKNDGYWIAGEYIDHDGEIHRQFEGNTPEQAVKNLWIALNKK